METILIHMERLRKHYEISIRTYDHVSLLDLSNILRIWVELKMPLSKINKKIIEKKPFKTASPVRKLIRRVQNNKYIFSYLPEGVSTFASKGHLASGPNMDEGHRLTVSTIFRINSDSSLTLSQFCVISTALEEEYIKIIKQASVTRCNYANWLGSEILRINYVNKDNNYEKIILSREMLIKRMANILDGSHASLAKDNNGDKKNQFDDAVRYFMNHNLGGLPLPYFILLKIAKDILDNMPALLTVS